MSTLTQDAGSGAEVLSLLSEQRDLCRQLGQFVELQRSLITSGDAERLLTLLGDRQHLLDRMSHVGQRLRAFQRNWPAVRAGMAPADAARSDALIADVNRLLAAILKTDEADAQLLSARKNATAQDLGQVRQGRQVGAAYTAATAPASSRVEWVDE